MSGDCIWAGTWRERVCDAPACPKHGKPQAMNVEWHGRADFAEVAEALGVDTDCVMAATVVGDNEGWLVLYTPEHADDPRDSIVHRALLERGADGVLRMVKHATAGRTGDYLPDLP
jgi:hypothetical protein